MIPIVEYEYTDFIQLEESETFMNGIASMKQEVKLLFDDRVDLESSLVIYDGQNIDLLNDPKIDVEKEGISELVYILKDIDGYPLEQGQKEIILDTKKPTIEVKLNDEIIENTIVIDQDSLLHISICDDCLDNYHIYIDGQEFVCESNEFDFEIEKNIKKIQIDGKDQAGNYVEQEYIVEYIKYPIVSDLDEKYICQDEFILLFDDSSKSFDLEVYVDDTFEMSIPIENVNEIQIPLEKNGKYTFQLRHHEYSDFIKKVNGSIIHSNIDPVIRLLPSSTYTNSDVNVDIQYICDGMLDGYYEIIQNDICERYPLMSSFELSHKLNTNLYYEVRAYIYDLFGRSAMDTVNVNIDSKAPVSNLIVNDTKYDGIMDISDLPSYSFSIDKQNTNMKSEVYLNGVLMNESFENVFMRMKKNDVLKLKTYISDSLSNMEIKEYAFVYKPIVKEVSTSNETIKNLDVIENERIWSLDENEQLVLKEKNNVIDKTKPSIHYSRENNIVRIWLDQSDSYSSDRFVSIYVNGYKMDLSKLKKDVLNNDYLDVRLNSIKNKIEIKAIDESGNESLLTIYENLNVNAFLIISLTSILCFLVYFLIRRLK